MELHNGSVNRMYDFDGKVALVTGSGQGIGEAAAIRLAREGAVVGVFDRNPESASRVVETITAFGGKASPLIGDVSDSDGVREIVKLFEKERGSIDFLVNNAGFDRPGGFMKLVADDFRSVWEVHFIGTVNFIMACSRNMIEKGHGSIVNVSSIYGKVGCKGESAYSSAKAAIVGLTKSLAREFGRKGIRINAVMPGLTATPTILSMMSEKIRDTFVEETPLGRIAQPHEIASVVAFLLSDESSFITGSVIEATGGWGM